MALSRWDRETNAIVTSSDPNLYAFGTDGTKLAAVPVGGSNAGIAVSRGRLFLGTGNIFSGGFNQPGSITALGR